MTVELFLSQFITSPYIKTIYIDSAIWDELPAKLRLEFNTKISNRKNLWDWVGKTKLDDRDLNFINAFNDPSKKIIYQSPYGQIEFKRRNK